MAFSDVATVGFAIRNVDKTSSGDWGRLPVAIGQTVNAAKAGSEYAAKHDNCIFRVLKQVCKTTKKFLEKDSVFKGVSGGVEFISNNINPLIVVSSGYNVLTAKKEERKKTLFSEAGCIAGMFLGEGWMKKNLNPIIEKLPVSNKWKPVIKGLIFIGGSIGSSTIGQILGEKIYNNWDKTSTSSQKVYQPMNVKA